MSKWSGTKKLFIVDYFITRSATHSRNLRRSGDVSLPRCRLSVGQRGFYFRGAKRWNDLPNEALKILRFLRKDWLIVYLMYIIICIFNAISYYLSDLLF